MALMVMMPASFGSFTQGGIMPQRAIASFRRPPLSAATRGLPLWNFAPSWKFTAAYHEEVNRQRAGLAGDRHRQQQELTGIERRMAAWSTASPTA
jgi:hypothetical protein